MTSLVLLTIYALALMASSLVGGRVPRFFSMTHTRAQLAMSFVSGVMLGIAFLHLLPHALAATPGEHAVNEVMHWVIAGLVIMLLLLRLLHFHPPDYPAQVNRCDHGDAPAADGSHAEEAPVVRWQGVLIGLLFHTFIDGMALGAAMLGGPARHEDTLLGIGIFLAILLHKPLDAMSIAALMRAGDASRRAQTVANLSFALVCPAGALFVFLILGNSPELRGLFLGPVLAFSAGAFICIALGDLLPEVQFHHHDRLKLTIVFLLGIGIAFLMEWAAPQHRHAPAPVAVVSGR